MAETFTFELASPEKLQLSKAVSLVTVPGGEGDYGVMSGHAPMITTIKTGVIEVFAENTANATDRIFVAGGFAEVTPSRCTVLASDATPVAELKRDRLEEQARVLAEKLASASEGERAAIMEQQAIVAAKIEAAEQHAKIFNC